jgi:signal transduction histidine kinase
LALVKSSLFKTSYQQLDNFILDNSNELSKKQRKELEDILPQLASETSRLKRLKDKINIKDILVSSLSRLIENKTKFIDTLCLNLEEVFNLSSIAFIDTDHNIHSLNTYTDNTEQQIKKRIIRYIKQDDKYGQVFEKENNIFIYCFDIYTLSKKVATIYFEREIELKPNDLEIVEEICDIVGALYYQVILYETIITQHKYTTSILEATDEIQIILNQDDIIIDFSNNASDIFKNIRKNITLGKFMEEEEEEEEVSLLRDFFIKNKQNQNTTHISYLQNRYFKVIYKPISINNNMIILYDVSDLKEKEQLLQSQGRLSAVGEMMENITHQWKQPLNIIIGLSDVLMRNLANNIVSDKNQQYLNHIVTNSKHLNQTIDDFRRYSTQLNLDEQKNEIFHITESINSTLNIFEYSSKQNRIELSLNIIDDFKVYGHIGQLNQVITNILNNAKDALSGVPNNRKITIITNRIKSKNILTIEDNGGGIPKDVITKVFEPYFTTKFKDQGTGIGLYMSYNIINKMNGTITATNTPQGAKFIIEFNNNGEKI